MTSRNWLLGFFGVAALGFVLSSGLEADAAAWWLVPPAVFLLVMFFAKAFNE